MRPPKEMTADSIGEMVRSEEYPTGNKYALKRYDKPAILLNQMNTSNIFYFSHSIGQRSHENPNF